MCLCVQAPSPTKHSNPYPLNPFCSRITASVPDLKGLWWPASRRLSPSRGPGLCKSSSPLLLLLQGRGYLVPRTGEGFVLDRGTSLARACSTNMPLTDFI